MGYCEVDRFYVIGYCVYLEVSGQVMTTVQTNEQTDKNEYVNNKRS